MESEFEPRGGGPQRTSGGGLPPAGVGGTVGGVSWAVTARLSGHVPGLSGPSVKGWNVALGLASPPVICDGHARFLQAGLWVVPPHGGGPPCRPGEHT